MEWIWDGNGNGTECRVSVVYPGWTASVAFFEVGRGEGMVVLI